MFEQAFKNIDDVLQKDDLGRPEDIALVFAGFQKYLYQNARAA